MNAIDKVHARQVWDSRGYPTVEVEVRTTSGATGRGIAPAGASRGSNEAIDLRDGGARIGGKGVHRAIAAVSTSIAPALIGRDVADQAGIDRLMLDLDGSDNCSRLGGNAIVATSMAVLNAAAASAGLSLWRYLAAGRPVRLPLPQVQIFGGGAHAGRRIDIQDLMVIATGAKSFAQAMEMTADVYYAAGRIMDERQLLRGVADEGGWWPAFDNNEQALETLVRAIERAGYVPGDEVAIALDIASSEFGKDGRYRLALESVDYDSAGMCELLLRWLDRYPIVSIEDPLAEDDEVGLIAFTKAAGSRVQIVGDDYLVTNADRVTAAAARGACNAVLLKPNQAGTISATKAAFEAAQASGYGSIVSARSGETEDVIIVHLSTGWNAGQLKVGSFARSERMAKWNEAIRIEEEGLAFAGRSALASGQAAAH
jgi:enolase